MLPVNFFHLYYLMAKSGIFFLEKNCNQLFNDGVRYIDDHISHMLKLVQRIYLNVFYNFKIFVLP